MCLISIIAVVNWIWFIGDRLLSKAFQFLMHYKERFSQLVDYDGCNTRFSEATLLEHAPAVVLDMLNHYKHLSELINMGCDEQR